MRTVALILFWISVFMPVYTYAVYPCILRLFKKKNYIIDESYCPKVSVIISAYNEEKDIEDRVKNLSILDYPKDKIEFVIGSDGSSDNTNNILSRMATEINELKFVPCERGGKVSVLNKLLELSSGEIIVFSDANTEFDAKCIRNIVRNFADERIGCVSGQLRLKTDDLSGNGAVSESAYWKYENIVKKYESRIGRLSGANGPIYAIRKSLCERVKPGIINDDFYISTYVLQSGYDVVMDSEAIAYEKPNDDMASQFRRHVRDGAGHYQALSVFWRLLLPRHGSFVHVSHRVIKWIVPFGFILAFLSNIFLAIDSLFFTLVMMLQVIGYISLILYYYLVAKKEKKPKNKVMKLFGIVYYFMSTNYALFVGFLRLITGKQKATWSTQR